MTFEEFTAADLASWLEQTRSEYIAERMAAGDTLAEASANADASLESTFPSGVPAPGQMTGWVCCDGVRVGELWIGPHGTTRSGGGCGTSPLTRPGAGRVLGVGR